MNGYLSWVSVMMELLQSSLLRSLVLVILWLQFFRLSRVCIINEVAFSE